MERKKKQKKHHFGFKNKVFLNEGLAHMHFTDDWNSTSRKETQKHSRHHDAGGLARNGRCGKEW